VGGMEGMEGWFDGVRVLVVVFGLAIVHWIEGLAVKLGADSSFLLASFTLFLILICLVLVLGVDLEIISSSYGYFRRSRALLRMHFLSVFYSSPPFLF